MRLIKESLMHKAWVICLLLLLPTAAIATFSIVAVDTETGAVGGAGASCIDNSRIINDLIEGIGAIHTQAYYLAQNQTNAHSRMLQGLTPDSIIGWLVANDVEGDPGYRQYGVVTLAGPGASAGYTGNINTPWAGHLTGPGYSIQGNILLDGWIIDSMQAAFLRTTGPLEEKLMAALMAANTPGADTRCWGCNKPAISAFIKVVHIGDGATPYLWEYVDNTICLKNPLDSLLVRFNAWKALRYADPELSTVTVDKTILPAGGQDSIRITVTPLNNQGQPPSTGAEVAIAHSGEGTLSSVIDNDDGTFMAFMKPAAAKGVDSIRVTVTAGEEATLLTQQPVLTYYRCGDVDADGKADIRDITFLINFLYKGGPAPNPLERGDLNNDGKRNIQDVTYMIAFLYKGGPPPICP
jgi:uncharacterized Ntn-hydrolase superfamily protein